MPADANLMELDELIDIPFSKFGQRLSDLMTLTKNRMPVPACLVVTKQAMQRIALANPSYQTIQLHLNELNSSRSSILQRTQLIEKISQKIAEFAIPQQFTNEYYQAHEKHFGTTSVNLFSESGSNHLSQIEGEVNILKAILFLWSREFIHQTLRSQPQLELIPTRIVLLLQPKQIFTGRISSKHPEAKHHAWLRITTAHGNCWLDSRSWVVIEKPRELTLNNETLAKIGQTALPIFRKNLHSLTLRWVVDQRHRLWFTKIEHSLPQPAPASSCSLHTATRQFLSLTPTSQLPTSTSHLEGILGLNSEQFFHLKGFHPSYLLNTDKESRALRTSILNHLNTLSQKLPGKFLAYRSYSADSNQRSQLQLGQTYENFETNPFLGRRGPSYWQINPRLFEFELNLIAHHLATHSSPFGLIVPWIRNQYEFRQVFKQISQTELIHQPHFSLWLELNSPGLILADDLPSTGVNGYILNVKNIIQTSFALDPTQPDIDTITSTEITNLIKQLMQNLSIATMRHHQKLILLLSPTYPALIQEVVTLGWYGITTSVADADECHSLLLTNEKELVNQAMKLRHDYSQYQLDSQGT